MKVIVDAQLPYRLSEFLSEHSIDSKHTLDLPNRNHTSDNAINKIAIAENRIVISKDNDFFESYILEKTPEKLLIVSTGNINNNDLLHIFEQNTHTLKLLFKNNSVVENNEEEIQVHY